MRASLLSLFPLTLMATSASASPRPTGEEQLAKMIAGRIAGQPVECIRTYPSSSDMTVIDRTAIVFRRGSTLYVNRTRDPSSLDDREGLFIRKFGNGADLCRTETVTTFNPNGHYYTGNIFLSEFVPYTKAK